MLTFSAYQLPPDIFNSPFQLRPFEYLNCAPSGSAGMRAPSTASIQKALCLYECYGPVRNAPCTASSQLLQGRPGRVLCPVLQVRNQNITRLGQVVVPRWVQSTAQLLGYGFQSSFSSFKAIFFTDIFGSQIDVMTYKTDKNRDAFIENWVQRVQGFICLVSSLLLKLALP